MGLLSEQNIFFEISPWAYARIKFLSSFKIRLKIHFLSKSRSIKMLWYKIQFQDRCLFILRDTCKKVIFFCIFHKSIKK
jgi:hypothetical protein